MPYRDLPEDFRQHIPLCFEVYQIVVGCRLGEKLRRYPNALEVTGLLAERCGVTPDQVLVTAGGDDALDRIADAMDRAGREAVALWQGHGNAANDYGVGVKRGQISRMNNVRLQVCNNFVYSPVR